MMPESKTPPNFIKGYTLYIRENPDNPSKTGTAIAIKSDIPHRKIDVSSSVLAIGIEIDYPYKVTLLSLYIPGHLSNKTIKTDISKLLNQFSSPILLMGDFNGHSTLWGCSDNNSRGVMLGQLFDEFGLTLLNDGTHTRICPSTGNSSALDLSLCSHSLGSQLSWMVHDDCCCSDHLPIVISLNRAPPVSTCRPRWKYEQADWVNYQNEVFHAFTVDPPNSADDFVKQLFQIASNHIPRSSGAPGKKSVPWWNSNVHSAVKLRRKKLRALQRLPKEDRKNSEIFAEFKAARNAARATVKLAKQDSWDQFISSINPESSSKELWDKINRLSGKKARQSIKLRINNQITEDPSTITNHLADHFAQSSSSSNYSDRFISRKSSIESSPLNLESDDSQEYNRNFSFDELQWALHKVHGSSAGPDDVGYPLIKNLPLIGKTILLTIFNNIWNQGEIPDSWKEGLAR